MKPLQLSKPHIIVMVGIPGSGKSFFAEHFANTFNASCVSYKTIRHNVFTTPARTDFEKTTVHRVADYMLEELLKTNQTIIFDGPTDTQTDRLGIAKLARSAGYEPLLVWVQTESMAAKARATKKSKDNSQLSAEQFDNRVKHFTPPKATERVVVISGKHTYASQLKIVLKHLVEPRIDAVDQHAHNLRSAEGRRIIIR